MKVDLFDVQFSFIAAHPSLIHRVLLTVGCRAVGSIGVRCPAVNRLAGRGNDEGGGTQSHRPHCHPISSDSLPVQQQVIHAARLGPASTGIPAAALLVERTEDFL